MPTNVGENHLFNGWKCLATTNMAHENVCDSSAGKQWNETRELVQNQSLEMWCGNIGGYGGDGFASFASGFSVYFSFVCNQNNSLYETILWGFVLSRSC